MKRTLACVLIAIMLIASCAPSQESPTPSPATVRPSEPAPGDQRLATPGPEDPRPPKPTLLPAGPPTPPDAPPPIAAKDPAPTPGEAQALASYPGAVQCEVPDDLKQAFGDNKIRDLAASLAPAAADHVVAWCREHLPDWFLQNETRRPAAEKPAAAVGICTFERAGRGILLYTRGDDVSGKTLLVVASGPWPSIECCNGQLLRGLGGGDGQQGLKSEGPALSKATPLAWVPDVLVQPVPAGASSVRLQLPVPIDKIAFGDPEHVSNLVPFGCHGGGHPEGFDHIVLPVQPGTIIGSWADGDVREVKPWGDEELGEFAVIIDYGDGLMGIHSEVQKPLVKVGDRVKAGDPIGQGMSFLAGSENAEFALIDRHRTDGPDEDGVHVSGFDYLRKDVQEQFIAAYRAALLDPYLSKGTPVGLTSPWEPYLTNPLLIHQRHKGTPMGEWYLNAPWAIGGPADVLVFKGKDSPYYGQRVTGMDNSHGNYVGGATYLFGSWEADAEKGQIKIVTDRAIYYGIYALDESGARATLKIEYQEGSYPTGFSERAVTYMERRPITRLQDAAELGVLPPS